MKRSVWKLPYIHPTFLKKRNRSKNLITTKIRNSIISNFYVDKKICIYNGIWFLSKDISSTMVGLKLGEFSFTKRSDTQLHIKRKSKKKSKKR